MATIGSKEFNRIIDDFRDSRNWLQDVSVEIEGGENELDPLTLLRMQEKEPNTENLYPLASQLVMNKRVVFVGGTGQQLLAFVYTGGELASKFKQAPYLLDVLLKTSWGLLLKKLTPPSGDSETEERDFTDNKQNVQ